MDGCTVIVLEFLIDIVIVVLAIGFIGAMFCSELGVEWDGWVWFLSVVIVGVIAGLIYWLIHKLSKWD